MKRQILIILTALIYTSCEDMLIESPKSLAVETFYNTTDEIESALYAIYDPMKSTECFGGLYPALHEAMSDFSYGRGSYAVVSEYQGLDNNNITRVGQMWNQLYRTIRNANLVIKNTPDASKVDEIKKAEFIGEARFLRAFTYFTLVRNWGGVPLRDEKNMNELNLARSTPEEVYDLILDDLTYAELYLPESSPLPGRPSKWTAKTVLADVYLYCDKWENSRDKALEVINSGRYSLVPVLIADDFQKIFGPDVSSSAEEIFALKYIAEDNLGFLYPLFLHHPGAGYHGGGGYYALYTDFVDNPLMAEWDEDDLRRQFGYYKYDIGLGPNTLLSRKFQAPSATTGLNASNDYPLYRYADLLLMYAEAANRASRSPNESAMECVNQVRRRAYGFDPSAPSAVDYKLQDFNYDTFTELIIKERGYETVFEAKRWLDLKRVGAKDRILSARGIVVSDKHLLWPIPISETTYNDAIDPLEDQNFGY